MELEEGDDDDHPQKIMKLTDDPHDIGSLIPPVVFIIVGWSDLSVSNPCQDRTRD